VGHDHVERQRGDGGVEQPDRADGEGVEEVKK